MSSKDFETKTEIEIIMGNGSVGQNLKNYFENLPAKNIRRAISILSRTYPDKITISDDNFIFITYLFSNEKFIVQESFFEFVCAINIIDFTEKQKSILINIIKNNMKLLCENCTFELDKLLVNLLEPNNLIQYLEKIIKAESNIAVLQHVSDILRYEDISKSNVSNEKIEELKQKVSNNKLLIVNK